MGAGECIPGLIELPAGNPRRRRRLAPWPSGTLERWPAGRCARVAAGMPGTGPLFHRSSVPPGRGAPCGSPPQPELRADRRVSGTNAPPDRSQARHV